MSRPESKLRGEEYKPWPWTKSDLWPVFVNKVFLGRQPFPFAYILSRAAFSLKQQI